MVTIVFGTIIHATMRPQDLIPAFLVALRSWNPKASEAIAATIPHDKLMDDSGLVIIDDHPWWQSEDCDEALVELFDALDAEAPEGAYFGAHPGDGSDFGFWPVDFLD